MDKQQEQVLTKVTRWIRQNEDCPLPLDLAAQLMELGLDVEAVEASIREEL
jgi:hypothetical protein